VHHLPGVGLQKSDSILLWGYGGGVWHFTALAREWEYSWVPSTAVGSVRQRWCVARSVDMACAPCRGQTTWHCTEYRRSTVRTHRGSSLFGNGLDLPAALAPVMISARGEELPQKFLAFGGGD
jgi:hypothetical protein